MPTEESRIQLQTQNTEETPNERAEEQRTGYDNEHQTHQQLLAPSSMKETIATTVEPQNEERRPLRRKINTVCIFTKKKSC